MQISGLLGLSVALGSIHAAVAQSSDDRRFAYTRVFTQSPIFYGACVGPECTPTAEFSAFRKASRDQSEIVSYLVGVFDQATAAGKIYIAKAVQQHDPQRAQPLFSQLKTDKRQVEIAAGCMGGSEPVSAVAEALEQTPFEDDLPNRPQ